MKTIEVTDGMYEALIELSKEMKSQDNRSTAMPHMFQIRSKKEVAAYSGCGEEIWVDSDGGELRSEEDVKNYIVDYFIENEEEFSSLSDLEAKQKSIEKHKEMDSYEIDRFLEEREYHQVEVTTESEYINTFFTAKACEEHIKQNHYHYNNADCYLNHAWRNPEMELVSAFLCGITN